MKKMLLLLASVLVLTACTQPKKEAKEATASKTEQTTKASSSAKEEKGLKFSRASIRRKDIRIDGTGEKVS